jgi:glycerophosphoryl diester phosphodiesterase
MSKLKYLVLLFALAIAVPSFAKSKTKVIAHRGYWKTEGSAQNSIASITKANALKVYGSEFDVHLTSDNVPVVYHDMKVDGVKIQDVPYSRLKDIKLANGETIPTLEEYLNTAVKLKNIKLIFELKSHATPEREREAAKMVVDMINARKLTKRTEYIAFSKVAAEELHKLSPKTPVYYLNGDLNPQQIKDLGFAGMDYHYNVFKKNPDWIKQAHDLGLKVNVWTVDSPEVLKVCYDNGVDFITTDEPIMVKEYISSNK